MQENQALEKNILEQTRRTRSRRRRGERKIIGRESNA